MQLEPSDFLIKEPKTYIGEKTAVLHQMMLEKLVIYMQKTEMRAEV
jgi:hypothetical protein